MKPIKNYKSLFVSAFLFILPLVILLVNYTASKLTDYDLFKGGTIMLAFLFLYSLIVIRRNFVYTRESVFLLLFFVFSIPAYFASSFTSVESYVRYFGLISFVPIGFMSGLTWGNYFKVLDERKRDALISVLLIPCITTVVILVIVILISNVGGSRDYVFGVLVYLSLLLYYKKRLWPILLFIVIVYICIVSSKRTGLLCVAAMFPLLLYKFGSFRRKLPRFLFVLLVSLVAFYGAYRYYRYNLSSDSQLSYSIERLENMDDESNEARLSMYTRTLSFIKQSDLISILFGHGCMSTSQLYGHPTHNDYLEILYDYGLFPLLFILGFIVSVVLRIKNSIKKHLPASLVVLSALLIYLLTTMGNCMFTNCPIIFSLMFTLGFSISNLKNSYVNR